MDELLKSAAMDKLVDEFGNLVAFAVDSLQKVAEKLGVSVDYLIPIFVKNSYVKGYQMIMWGTLCLIFGIIFWYKEAKDKWLDGFGYIISISCFIGSGTFTHWAIYYLVNPEYAALRSLINMISRLINGGQGGF